MKYILTLSASLFLCFSVFSQSDSSYKKLDSILTDTKKILKFIDNEKEIEQLKQDRAKDSAAHEKIVAQFKKELDVAKMDKNNSDISRSQIQQESEKIKKSQKENIEAEISLVIKKDSKVDIEILKLLSSRAAELNASNSKSINGFIEICDSMKSIRTIFNHLYDPKSINQGNLFLAKVKQLIQKGSYKGFENDVLDLQDELDNYCYFTNKFYEFLAKAYLLQNDNIKSVGQKEKFDAFTLELNKAYYYMEKYNALLDIYSDFFEGKGDTREKYKKMDPIVCK